jgi:tight adherence protein B
MITLIIAATVFVGVAALVGGVAVMLRGPASRQTEDRLDQIMGREKAKISDAKLIREGILAGALEEQSAIWDDLFSRFGNLGQLFEQADTSLTPSRFFLISGVVGVAGGIVSIFAGFHIAMAPMIAVLASGLPLMWVFWRRKKRLKQFGRQLPEALELTARALRSGHSLSAAFSLVAEESNDPIAKEFGQVFEEQNLGVSLEDALEHLTQRVPNLDLKFFATAVILQRQTGGNLAEILEKIGNLVRERYEILGQVQALTGEGRLSGVVLLGLPPVLFVAVYRLNPEYASMLLTDPMGKKLLAGAIVMQLLGAIVIRKIVNIKV